MANYNELTFGDLSKEITSLSKSIDMIIANINKHEINRAFKKKNAQKLFVASITNRNDEHYNTIVYYDDVDVAEKKFKYYLKILKCDLKNIICETLYDPLVNNLPVLIYEYCSDNYIEQHDNLLSIDKSLIFGDYEKFIAYVKEISKNLLIT